MNTNARRFPECVETTHEFVDEISNEVWAQEEQKAVCGSGPAIYAERLSG